MKTKSSNILSEVFSQFNQDEKIKDFTFELADLIHSKEVNSNEIKNELSKYDLSEIRKDKVKGLNLILEYARIICLTSTESEPV